MAELNRKNKLRVEMMRGPGEYFKELVWADKQGLKRKLNLYNQNKS